MGNNGEKNMSGNDVVMMGYNNRYYSVIYYAGYRCYVMLGIDYCVAMLEIDPVTIRQFFYDFFFFA